MRLHWFTAFANDERAGPSRALRGWLRRRAPSWLCSPLRRAAQTASLVLFLGLFFYVCWPYTARPLPDADGWPAHYTQDFAAKELLPADAFLNLDPLVGISTALAGRTWTPAMLWAVVVLLVCLLIPRGFCGYLCPFGTFIDLFDWALGRRLKRFRVKRDGWWVHLKYYILLACLISSLFGLLLTGFLAAIPVLTRGLLLSAAPLHLGLAQGWHRAPPLTGAQWLSLALFLGVLALGFLRPRFWCRYVCPSGAIFSIANLARLTDRKVASSCTACGKCRRACPFDAIAPDFSTRALDCTFCQTCGGACPPGAINFVWRANVLPEEIAKEPSAGVRLSRRGFLGAAVGGAAGALGVQRLFGAGAAAIVRPPGSIPEPAFLRQCIRCGACMKVCPNNVLQPLGFAQGIEGLWTPAAATDWAGCEPSCNLCTEVCPTGAIRPLPLEEKRVARMGLAVIDEATCLPYANREACQLCYDECRASGYDAIEFVRLHVELDEDGLPREKSGYLAPVVLPDLCVGCALCQGRCYGINVKDKRLLGRSAVEVFAGAGKEDRLESGSYLALRAEEKRRREEELRRQNDNAGDSYLPDFLQ